MHSLTPRPPLPGHWVELKDGRQYRTKTDRLRISRRKCSCGCGERIGQQSFVVEWDRWDINGVRGITFSPFIRSHYDNGR